MSKVSKLIEKRQMRQMMKDYFFILMGIVLYSVGYTAFLLPENLVMGGVTGISSLLYYAFGWNPAICIWTLNILMLTVAFHAISKQFVIRTLIGVSLMALVIGTLKPLFEAYPIVTPGEDKFMHIIIAAMLGGAGLALVFIHNGSTGGTDILLALINKYSRMSMGRAMQFIDIAIICSSYMLFHSFELIVYGVVFTLVASIMLDYVLNGSRQTVQFLIISKHYEKMADAMNHQLNRGVTILNGQGWYSKQDVRVVMVLCRKYESQYAFNLIKSIDPNAMVSQQFCHGVFGEGFDKIK